MKTVIGNGVLILIIIGVFYLIYVQECKRDPVPEGMVMVSESAWDSIQSIDMTPKVIHQIDTLIIEKPIYIKIENPEPVTEALGTTHYQDSIVNDSIRFWEDIWVEGLILSWQKKYEPIIHYHETTVEIKVPQIITNEVPVHQRELYLSGAIGGHIQTFSYGVDLDYINRKRNVYGLQYRRVMDENFYYFKIGTKILPRK